MHRGNYHYENPNANGRDGVPRWRSTYGGVAPGTLPFDSGRNFQEELRHPLYGSYMPPNTHQQNDRQEYGRIPGSGHAVVNADSSTQSLYQMIRQAQNSKSQSESANLYKQAVDIADRSQNTSLQALSKVEFGLAHFNWGYPQQGFKWLLEAGSNNPSLYDSSTNQSFLNRLSQAGMPQSAVDMLIRNGQQDPNWYLKDPESLSKLDKSMAGPVYIAPQNHNYDRDTRQDYQSPPNNSWQSLPGFDTEYYKQGNSVPYPYDFGYVPSLHEYEKNNIQNNSIWPSDRRIDYRHDSAWQRDGRIDYGENPIQPIHHRSNYGFDHAWQRQGRHDYGSDHAWQRQGRHDYGFDHAWQRQGHHDYGFDHAWRGQGRHDHGQTWPNYHPGSQHGPCIPHKYHGRHHFDEGHHRRNRHDLAHSWHDRHRYPHRWHGQSFEGYGQDGSWYGNAHGRRGHHRYASYYEQNDIGNVIGRIFSAIGGLFGGFQNHHFAYGRGYGRHGYYANYGSHGYRPHYGYHHQSQQSWFL